MKAFSFAAAMPPRSEMNFPSERWLDAIADAGYTHLCLQADPFFHPEMQLRDTWENTCRLLFLYDIAAGPRRRAYQAWIGAVGERAARHGLRLTLELWEPRLSRLARQALPPAWLGPEQSRGWVQPLCVGQPDARAWLLDGFRTLLRASPHIDCLVLGINDNGAHLCRDCASCPEPPIDRLAALYADVEAACLEQNPAFRLVLYDWMWGERQYDAVMPRLRQRPFVLTRMQRGVRHTPDPEHPEWHGTIADQYLGTDSTGPCFRQAQQSVARHGGAVLVMPTLSGMFEALFLPCVPAVGQVAGKFATMRREGVTGWVDFDVGGIAEGLILDLVKIVQHDPASSADTWLDTLATARYGRDAIALARAIWAAFDAAVKLSPVCLEFADVRGFSGTYPGTMNLVVMHPFLPQRMGSGPYANSFILQNDPHRLATEQSIPAMRHFMPLMVARAQPALDRFPELLDRCEPTLRANAEVDFLIARLVVLSWQSNVHFFEWAAAMNGDKDIDLAAVLAAEIETTRAYRDLSRDPRVDHGNATLAWQRMVAMSVPQTSADFYHAIQCDGLVQWLDPNPYPELAGDPFAWKIAHLQDQLARMMPI